MRTRTKVLLAALCAVVLVVGSVMGTLAYLTDTAEVKNTFTVGNVEIRLDEADVTPEGEPIVGADRVQGNEYHLVPGQTYTKDPTVAVLAGSENSYVRMLVTINRISQLRDALGADFLPQDYVTGWDNNIWEYKTTTEDTANNTITYEFRYYQTVDASQADTDITLEPLFANFTLPGSVTGEELQSIEGLQITVVAHAIQVLGFDGDDAAWTAFEAEQD